MKQAEKRSLNRAVIYSSDVMLITGLSEASARRILRNIRKRVNKDHYQYVTAKEFCMVTGIQAEVVQEYLKF